VPAPEFAETAKKGLVGEAISKAAKGGDFGEPFDRLRALSLPKGSVELFTPTRSLGGPGQHRRRGINPRF
jgi:hypothetical protein